VAIANRTREKFEVKKVLFVYIENSCRNQIAETLFNAMAKNAMAESAGTNPAKEVDENAIKVMKEIGIDMQNKKPRMLTSEISEKLILLLQWVVLMAIQ